MQLQIFVALKFLGKYFQPSQFFNQSMLNVIMLLLMVLLLGASFACQSLHDGISLLYNVYRVLDHVYLRLATFREYHWIDKHFQYFQMELAVWGN